MSDDELRASEPRYLSPDEARDRLTAPALAVAPLLLNAVLSHRTPEGTTAVRLTEVEAYQGVDDPASHAWRGPTPRTSVMFGPPGRLYCYFVYGMHWCVNVTCSPDGEASAVLLRAGAVLEAATGERVEHGRGSASGPARLARVLGLSGAQSGLDLLDPESALQLRLAVNPPTAASGPRVGVSRASTRPWRFWVPDDPTVTVYRRGTRASRADTGQTPRT